MNILIFKRLSVVRQLSVAALCGGLMVLCTPAQDASPSAAAQSVAVQPSATAAPVASLPAGIQAGSPLSQVVKLAEAGVDEGVIQSYVTNSTATFNLDPDKIIYLKDAGVPTELVTEMMQHDTVVQAQIAATAPPSPPATDITPQPPAPAPDNSQPPSPDPQVDDTAPPATIDSASDFDTALAPYGNWVVVDGYGSCWLPGVAIYNHDWQPYGDHGHWVYTDSGWYWASDYTWGWAPFHYGRWFRSPRFGWCWHPDTIWGPSWVTWRYTDDYCGWAPLPPGAYYGDSGWAYNGGVVGDDFDFGLDADSFVFVSTLYFTDSHPFHHHLDRNFAGQVYHRSFVLNNYQHGGQGVVNRGIDPVRITRATHTPVHTIPLRVESGVAGRYPANEAPHRSVAATSVYRAPSAAYQNYRPDAGQNPAFNRQPQPINNNNWQTQQRINTPAPERNTYYQQAPEPAHYLQPTPVQRPYAPAENYRPATLEPVVHQEPPRMEYAAPEPRPEPPPARVERSERMESTPARGPAPAPSAPARTSSSSSEQQKIGGH